MSATRARMKFVAYLTVRSNRQITALDPADEGKFRNVIGEAIEAIIGRTPTARTFFVLT